MLSGIEPDQILITALVMLSVGGALHALVYPWLSGDLLVEKRKNKVALLNAGNSARVRLALERDRKSVEQTLKELDDRRKDARSPPLAMRLEQAGLDIPKKRFMIYSGSAGVGVTLFTMLFGVPILVSICLGLICGIAMPNWILGYLKKKRIADFIEELPNAVDIIVRGIRSGLPVGDCFRIISAESKEPLRSEFQAVIDQQSLGVPMHEAVMRILERMPIPEANFFCIVMSIQQKSGGNLADTLGNLSKVLRERKKMKARIQAMSAEAKSSAGIIAALPFAVMLFVWLSTPDYISLLWTTTTGLYLLAACGAWMLLGVFVMKQMINFDF